VCADLCSAGAVQYNHKIGVPGGGQTMGNSKGDFALNQFGKGAENSRFRPVVECRGRLVHDQYIRITDQGTGDGNALLLTFGKTCAPLRFVSNLLAASNLLTIFHPLFKTNVISIKRNNQTSKLLVIGKKAVGKQVDGSEKWQIRFPYKYFIDKNRLDR